MVKELEFKITKRKPLFSFRKSTHEGVCDEENVGLNHMAIREVDRPTEESRKNSCVEGESIKT